MEKLKITVILGSIREGRAGEKVAKWFMEALKDSAHAQLELLDLRDYPLPLFADATPPSMRQGPHANAAVQKWLDKIAAADGFIIITPEYNHGYPGPLKNAIDYVYAEWNGKPVGFVSYGGLAAGSRAVEQLREVAVELQMIPVREQVMIPLVWQAFDANGMPEHADSLAKTADAMVAKVAELAAKLKA